MTRARTQIELSPEEALARWPSDWPLTVLWSGAGDAAGRWVVLGRPRGLERGDVRSREELREVMNAGAGRAMEAGGLRCEALEGSGACGLKLPLKVWALDYEMGRVIEPAVDRGIGEGGRRGGEEPTRSGGANEEDPTRRVGVPKTVGVVIEDAVVFDRRGGGVWEWGDLRAMELLDEARRESFEVGALRSDVGRRGYEDGVRRALEYIRAGDVYQVNLSHTLRGGFKGSTRALFGAMLEGARPRYGAYIEDERRTIISMSPESFLEFDGGTRRVVTRPMKGTRPAADGPSDLRESAKDRAELAMIVDLMRNDLGRVCVPGSMRVDAARKIETHAAGAGGGVLQATAEVSGTLRPDRSLGDLIIATFPGGSVTGAPKIRAMQIIEEVERGPRGMYCGAIGYCAADGSAALSIAIRTATIEDGGVVYPVGAGIVADSDPAGEWEETLVKAGVVGAVAEIIRE